MTYELYNCGEGGVMKIKVSSGGMDVEVDVPVLRLAFEQALDKIKPPKLGLLVGFTSDDLSDEFYCSTQTLLEELGRWEQR